MNMNPTGKIVNPVFFDADERVKIATAVGMKYIVITSKHRDRFFLWDSKVSDWDVMSASPFKRVLLEELAAKCEKHGMVLGSKDFGMTVIRNLRKIGFT